MIIIETRARTVCHELISPLLDELCPDDDTPTPRVQITVEPGRLSAVTASGVRGSMPADTDARAAFTVDGDYLLGVLDELLGALGGDWDAVIRVSEELFEIASPCPRNPGHDAAGPCAPTAIGPAFETVGDA